MIKSYILSKIWYYFPIALSFIIVSAIFLSLGRIGFMPSDWALGLASECWGISATVLFLMLLLELREYRQWSPVREKVLESIGRELYELFTDFTPLCKCTHTSGKAREESGEEYAERLFFTQLKQLNKKVELEEEGIEFFSKGGFATLFEKVASRLSNIEAKYSKFLHAPLRLSLMEIQDVLHSFSIDLSLRKEEPSWFDNDELFFQIVSFNIQTIVEEIYKIHKMGIGIYRPYPMRKMEYRL